MPAPPSRDSRNAPSNGPTPGTLGGSPASERWPPVGPRARSHLTPPTARRFGGPAPHCPVPKEPAVANRRDALAPNESLTPPAVIRRVEVAEEEAGSRVLHRHLPAWVISGAVHVAVIGAMLLVMSGPQDVEARNADPLTTQVEEPKDEADNLV